MENKTFKHNLRSHFSNQGICLSEKELQCYSDQLTSFFNLLIEADKKCNEPKNIGNRNNTS